MVGTPRTAAPENAGGGPLAAVDSTGTSSASAPNPPLSVTRERITALRLALEQLLSSAPVDVGADPRRELRALVSQATVLEQQARTVLQQLERSMSMPLKISSLTSGRSSSAPHQELFAYPASCSLPADAAELPLLLCTGGGAEADAEEEATLDALSHATCSFQEQYMLLKESLNSHNALVDEALMVRISLSRTFHVCTYLHEYEMHRISLSLSLSLSPHPRPCNHEHAFCSRLTYKCTCITHPPSSSSSVSHHHHHHNSQAMDIALKSFDE